MTSPKDLPPRRYCGAPRRQSEGTCERPAGWGTPHPGIGQCKLHGGCMPNNVKAAEKIRAQQAVRTYGLPLDTDPFQAILDDIRWTAGHVAWLRERVQELEQQQVVWGQTETTDKGSGEFTGVDTTEAAKPNLWVVLYQQERKHLLAACKTAADIGIDERLVRIAERQGDLLATVIRAILDDLSLTPDQAARVPEIVPRHLRAIA